MNNTLQNSSESTQRIRQPTLRRLKIEVGSYVKDADTVYKITQLIDFDSVIGMNVETGRNKPLFIKDLTSVGSDIPERTCDLAEVSDTEWKIAEQRLALIRAIVDRKVTGREEINIHAQSVGVHPTTLYRWYERFQGTQSVISLIPMKRGWISGKTRIASYIETVVQEVIDDFYLTPQRPTAQKAVLEVQRRCVLRGIEPPSPSTIRKRIRDIPERRRLRERGYKELAMNKFTPTAGSFPDADYPLAVVQIDHTPADIILVDDLHRQPIGRPWITLAIDVCTRMIAGYYLSFDAPSETSVAMCVAHAILPKEEWLTLHGIDAEWPVRGIPKKIHVDNGPDFRSDTFRRSCAAYGINLEFRPVKRPRYGGHVERVLGSILKEIHTLPGTTFSSIKQKEGYDPAKHASMTKSEFEVWLVSTICKVYHERMHSGIGMSPRKKWEIGIFGNNQTVGIGHPPMIDDRFTLLLNFLPSFSRTVQPTGVTIDGLRYYAEALRPWINASDPKEHTKKRTFVFRRDPRDISAIWFRDPTIGQYYKVPLSNLSMPPMSIWEYTEVRRELRKQGMASINETQILRAITELRDHVESTKERTKAARRKAQRRIEHEKNISPANPIQNRPEPQPAGQTSSLSHLSPDGMDGFEDIA